MISKIIVIHKSIKSSITNTESLYRDEEEEFLDQPETDEEEDNN